jgi:hypothetical protein
MTEANTKTGYCKNKEAEDAEWVQIGCRNIKRIIKEDALEAEKVSAP